MTGPTLAIAFLAAGAAGGSASPATPPPVALDTDVTLARGETAGVKDTRLEVGFVDVTEDSRCPSDVQCVWAGEVKVRLSLRRGLDEPIRTEVREGEAMALDGYRVILVRVTPYPMSTRPPRPNDYRATLKIVASPP
jgi:hypothetical protein